MYYSGHKIHKTLTSKGFYLIAFRDQDGVFFGSIKKIQGLTFWWESADSVCCCNCAVPTVFAFVFKGIWLFGNSAFVESSLHKGIF